MFQACVRQSIEFETQMISTERVLAYGQLASEAPLKTHDCDDRLNNWPRHGAIEFNNVSLTYEAAPIPVLNKITFKIQPSEKIGIVGRTGAGKSSLITVLFRL